MTNIVAKTDFAPTYVRWNNERYERKACRRCRAYRGLWAPSAAKITNLQPWSQSLNPRDQRPTSIHQLTPSKSSHCGFCPAYTSPRALHVKGHEEVCWTCRASSSCVPASNSIWSDKTCLDILVLPSQAQLIKVPFPNPPFSI